jgi:hypothetical protein
MNNQEINNTLNDKLFVNFMEDLISKQSNELFNVVVLEVRNELLINFIGFGDIIRFILTTI